MPLGPEAPAERDHGEGARRPLTVTVVVPAKDEAERLPRCLGSLARQTRLPQEVVVVDNG